MKYTGRKGWQASYRDTFCLDYTLSPIIHAGLVRFKEALLNAGDFAGIPSNLIVEQYGSDYKSDDITSEQLDELFDLWISYIDKMIYAFGDNEPDISKYDMRIKIESDEPREDGLVPVKINVGNRDEIERYDADEAKWNEKRTEGLELFAKYYRDLWW